MSTPRQRADRLLVERGLFESRTKAQAAIEAGLESAPIGVITTPGMRKPKYVSDLTARYHRPVEER